jgi:hypothetical protein
VDSCRLADVLATATALIQSKARPVGKIGIIGRGPAGLLAAYAALLEPRLEEVRLVDPPPSHRDGPVFLNVLRVLDVPEALGLISPRPLTITTSRPEAFERTASIYRLTPGVLRLPDSNAKSGTSD